MNKRELDRRPQPRSWDDATPDEIGDARIQALEESVQHLKDCVSWALSLTAAKDVVCARPEDVLDEEWSK